jgi:cell division protein FtsB
MTDQYQSHFDGITARAASRSRRNRFILGLLLGFILGGGLTLLWALNRSAPATKDLQSTEQRITGQLQSLQQTLASSEAETKQVLALQQAATKRLSDQVAGLNGKVDALQRSFATAQQESSRSPSEPSPPSAKKRR